MLDFSQNKELSVICIIGATASGKTDLALNLAQHIPCEIISVDSALIYKDMDIGTAKPSTAELESVSHHLISIISPEESFSVAKFTEQTNLLIKDVLSRNKYPVLVGGTMMYFNALFNGINNLPTCSPVIKQQVLQEIEAKSLAYVHAKLAAIDPVSAARIHANDQQRIIRAIGAYYASGSKFSDLLKEKPITFDFQFKKFALLSEDRSLLHKNIEQRLLNMLQLGFIEEVEYLNSKYSLSSNHPSYRCVGYKQIFEYLENEFDYDTMVFKTLVATRQLAKRQLTWIRSWDDLFKLNTFCKNNIDVILNQI